MSLLIELLEQMQQQSAVPSETGDIALDQRIRDIRKRNPNPQAAQKQIDAVSKQRMAEVPSRIRALMQRKKQLNQQIDKQIEQERQREARNM